MGHGITTLPAVGQIVCFNLVQVMTFPSFKTETKGVVKTVFFILIL